MSNTHDVIENEELLYRRVVGNPQYYDPEVDASPDPQAFTPTKDDLTGLSLYRAKHRAPQSVVGRKPGRRDWVAVLRVGDLRAEGIEVIVNNPDDPAHVEIQSMRYDNRKETTVIEMARILAKKLCIRIEGPFDPLPPLP